MPLDVSSKLWTLKTQGQRGQRTNAYMRRVPFCSAFSGRSPPCLCQVTLAPGTVYTGQTMVAVDSSSNFSSTASASISYAGCTAYCDICAKILIQNPLLTNTEHPSPFDILVQTDPTQNRTDSTTNVPANISFTTHPLSGLGSTPESEWQMH